MVGTSETPDKTVGFPVILFFSFCILLAKKTAAALTFSFEIWPATASGKIFLCPINCCSGNKGMGNSYSCYINFWNHDGGFRLQCCWLLSDRRKKSHMPILSLPIAEKAIDQGTETVAGIYTSRNVPRATSASCCLNYSASPPSVGFKLLKWGQFSYVGKSAFYGLPGNLISALLSSPFVCYRTFLNFAFSLFVKPTKSPRQL
jgi:hypothetical protein